MNLLVTGGSGFIGTRLVAELLEAGHEVAIYDLAPSALHPQRCIRADVRDLEALTAAATKRDAIIHLAAEHRDDAIARALCEKVNVGGAANLVHAAKRVGCRRIVFTSSVAVYPLNAPEVTEAFAPQPYNAYGESKLKAEQLFTQWARGDSMASLTIVRPCVIFGEGNRGNVYNLVRQIARGRFVMVGNGCNRKSMAYVGNLTRFLATCLGFPAGVHLYNYADKPDLSAGELVALTRRALSESSPSSISDFRASNLLSLRLPFWLGLCAGCGFDVLAWLTGRNFAITANRIRKFCAETTVSVERLQRTGFVRPYPLREAFEATVRADFLKAGPPTRI